MMEENIKELLREIVREWTDGGQAMACLPHTKEQVVYRLKETNRIEDAEIAAIIERADAFRFSGKPDGLVFLLTGPGFSQRETLIDFKGDDATD